MATWEPTKLEENFRFLRNDVADPKSLFYLLEGVKFEDINISEPISEDAFYRKYILFVILECHLSNDVEDCILAGLGFLAGYESLRVQERHELYCRNVGKRVKGDDMPFNKYWRGERNRDKNLNDRENRAIRKICKFLQNRIDMNNGRLGYVENNNIVTKIVNLTYPEPHYLRGEGYRKCEVDGEIFYVPLTKEELRLLASTDKTTPTLNSPVMCSPPPTPDWGDNGGGRPSYTLAQVQGGILGNTIVFNSISDGVIGNEKNFVGVREDDGIHMGADNLWHSNYITIEDKKTYIIRLYVHNNNPNGIRAIAKNVRAAIDIPALSAKQIQVTGFIESSNATPSKYWASVVFRSDESSFRLEYCYGSARLENNDFGKRFGKVSGIVASDDIVTRASSGGILVAYDTLDGSIPGCHQYANYVTIRVKAVFDEE